MTDPRAVAEKLIEQMGNYPGVSEHFRDEWRAYYKQDIDLIMHALTDARRQGMERIIEHLAATATTLPVQHEIESHGCCTYNWYRHVEKLLRAYAQASQEGSI